MLPQTVEKTMQKLCNSLSAYTSNIKSVYLYGSVALGDYIEGSSDIDFLAVLKGLPNDSDIEAISAAHKEVEALIPNTDIMGAYLLEKDFGKPHSEIDTFLTYFDKKLHVDGKGADLNPITWWILKNHGIRVYGSELSFNYPLEANTLVKYVIGNLNTYWVSWIDRLEKQLSLISSSDQQIAVEQLDEAVEWCALGMLRQLYTIKEHEIKSKIEAGLYGLKTIPPQWHELINEAIHIKRLQPERYYISQEKRLTDLVGLLRYIHMEVSMKLENIQKRTAVLKTGH
jgi:predicted nucleotidyltransferase